MKTSMGLRSSGAESALCRANAPIGLMTALVGLHISLQASKGSPLVIKGVDGGSNGILRLV